MKTKQSQRASRPQTRPRHAVLKGQDGQGHTCWFVHLIRSQRIVSRSYKVTDARLICRLLNQHRKG